MTSLVLVLLGLGLPGSPNAAPPSAEVCHALDSEGELVLRWVKSVATHAAGDKQRALMHLSLVQEEEVRYVTDEHICRRVLGEYNRYSGSRDARTGVRSPPSEQLCVVEVGPVYVVTDPTKMFGEFTIYVTMDHHFRMLAHTLG